jgi:chromosome segregation ATPase
MSTMYESLKEVVHEMSHRSKSEPIPLAAVKHSHAPSLVAKVDEAQQFMAEKLDGLKVALQQGEEMAEKESQRAEQVIAALRKTLAMAESQLTEAAEELRRKESASDAMEESLNAKIDALQKELGKEQETLQSRETQIADLKSNLDASVTQIRESESTVRQAQDEAAAERKRTQELKENFNQRIAALEADKQALLAARETETSDLKSQLELLTSWVKEMPSFIKQPETVIKQPETVAAVVEYQNDGGAVNNQYRNRAMEKPLTADQIVPPIFFDLIAQELVPIKGAMSSTIVRDRVAALGESTEKFPRSRLPALLEDLSEGIVNRNVKIAFRKWFVKHA